MDYEKKYKEALEKISKLYDCYNEVSTLIDVREELEEIFPELKESEDEKTKKEIINYLECQSRDEPTRKYTHNKWISYIKKHALSKDDYDFLRNCARVLKIFGYQSYADRLTGLCPALGEEAKAMMATPIIFDESEDEKIRKEMIFYFEQEIPQCSIEEHKGYMRKFIAWLEKQKPQRMVSAEAKEAMYNKPAWSEEDEKISEAIIKRISGESDALCVSLSSAICWVENIKDRVQSQPKQEWSEEDNRHIKWCIEWLASAKMINNAPLDVENIKEQISWLKSLRPQNTWKPSDEQIDALEDAIADSVYSIQKNMLNSLYSDLKKLK